MTFLQPTILWGLPLVLLPVIIHLINRMRHRTQPWAAMRFLVSATRSSVNQAKLRQFLILLFRVLAVAMLVLFVARPLAGGWLGWMLSPAPDAIIVLLDRSASMEARVRGGTETKREHALKLLAESLQPFEESSSLILIESVFRAPQTIAKAKSLLQTPLSQPTDTAADVPGLFQSALQWLVENRAGTAELWLASDLQQSNWRPDDDRWKQLTAQFTSLPQKIRVRLLTLEENEGENTSVALRSFDRRSRANESDLQLIVDFQRNNAAAQTVPVSIALNGAESQTEIALEGQTFRWRHRLPLASNATNGWGSLRLPPDSNLRDNAAYFVFGPPPKAGSLVVSRGEPGARILALASRPLGATNASASRVVSVDSFPSEPLEDRAIVLWTAPIPSGAPAEKLAKFVEEGGVVLFLPPGESGPKRFRAIGWGEVESTSSERGYLVKRWEEAEGPLSKTDEGLSLPLGQTEFHRRQAILGATGAMAAFDDATPLLVRGSIGKGEFYFLGSEVDDAWSSLTDGPVLVPMLQRLLAAGSRRLQQVSTVLCGELNLASQQRQWISADAPGRKEIALQAGVYKAGDDLLAVNRPPAEDEIESLDVTQTRALFGAIPVQMLAETRARSDRLQGEIWRMLLFAMLLFLIAEGILILPRAAAPKAAPIPVRIRANPMGVTR